MAASMKCDTCDVRASADEWRELLQLGWRFKPGGMPRLDPSEWKLIYSKGYCPSCAPMNELSPGAPPMTESQAQELAGKFVRAIGPTWKSVGVHPREFSTPSKIEFIIESLASIILEATREQAAEIERLRVLGLVLVQHIEETRSHEAECGTGGGHVDGICEGQVMTDRMLKGARAALGAKP